MSVVSERKRPKRSLKQGLAWWWQTRVQSWWTVKLPALRHQQRQAAAGAMQAQSGSGTLPFKTTAPPLPPVSASVNTAPTESSGTEASSITAILTLYKRGQYQPQQVEALRAQTCPPDEIWLWCNSSDTVINDLSELVDRVVVSNSNWKFWGRFALGNMARTRYLCFFDDDILPQPRWLEHCLQTYADGIDGILGGSGVMLPESGGYSSRHKVGWNGHHYEHACEVDLVGHAWFFRKEYLRFMWQQEPTTWENGEDIHLSYMALKHAGLSTWVPAHPESDPQCWSCRPDFGKAVGRSSTATFKSDGHHNDRDDIVLSYRADGWQVVSQRQRDREHASAATTTEP